MLVNYVNNSYSDLKKNNFYINLHVLVVFLNDIASKNLILT